MMPVHQQTNKYTNIRSSYTIFKIVQKLFKTNYSKQSPSTSNFPFAQSTKTKFLKINFNSMSYTNKVGKIYNKKGFSKTSVGLYQFDIHRELRMERIRNKWRIREKRTGEKIQDWSREKQRSVQKGKYKFTRCKKVGASWSVLCK